MDTRAVAIPTSVEAEHAEILAALAEATHAPGSMGEAARELAAVLHPHFAHEKQIALPPLGLVARLAAGQRVPDAALSITLAMADALKAELPGLLREHGAISAAVWKFRAIATGAEHAAEYERFAAHLVLHQQMEEEVHYPAAVLVGEIIRGRRGYSGNTESARSSQVGLSIAKPNILRKRWASFYSAQPRERPGVYSPFFSMRCFTTLAQHLSPPRPPLQGRGYLHLTALRVQR